jgi:hypothetical protein
VPRRTRQDVPACLNLGPRFRYQHRTAPTGAVGNTIKELIMRKMLALLAASAMLAGAFSTNALAWDDCGHGLHRNYYGVCVSNYGRSSGCPWGYHLGWNVHACVPN